MSKFVDNIPLIEPSIEVGKGLYEAGSGYKRTLEAINNVKEKGIIKSGKEIVKNTKNVSRGIKKVMKNLPIATRDLQFLINLYTKKEIKFDGTKTIEYVKQHFEKNKERFEVMGVISEFQGTAAAAGSFKDRIFRFLEAIGSKVKNAKEIVTSSVKDAIWLDADGDVVFSNDKGLFKINGASVVQLSPNQVENFIRLDTLSKLISKSAEKKKAYKDENNNKYYLEEKNGVARLKQFWDGKEFTFVDRYIEGPWPELNSLGKSYKEEIQRWQDVSNESMEILENFRAGRYTTPQATIKERRIKELQELISKDKRFLQNHVNPAIVDFLINKAIESGIEPKMIQSILNGELDISNEETEMMNEIINIQYEKDIPDKEKEQQLRKYLKLHGYNMNKFLKENDIGINQILKIQEQLQVLANTARNYNPSLIKDIGVVNTFGFLNFVGGTAELVTSIPIGQILGVGFSTLLMLLLSKTIKLGLLGAIKLTKVAISALWKYFTQEKLVPYEDVKKLYVEAIVNNNKIEEDKWWGYMQKHYSHLLPKVRTPARAEKEYQKIKEVKLEEKPIELFPKTNIGSSSFGYRETKEDQELDLVVTESKKLKSMPKSDSGKRIKYSYGTALNFYNHSKHPNTKQQWLEYIETNYPITHAQNQGLSQVPESSQALVLYSPPKTNNSSPKVNISLRTQIPKAKIPRMSEANKYGKSYYSDPIPIKVEEVSMDVEANPQNPPPIVDEPNSLVPLPNINDTAPRETKRFKAERPEPNVSLNAFFGPKYIYKTPKQMKMYGKQSKTRNLKRKWSLGARMVAKKFRS